MKGRTIPVVLSCDRNYALPMYVTFLSILKNRGEETKYKFYFLVQPEVDKLYKEAIDNCLVKEGMPEAEWIDMGHAYEEAYVHVKHLSYAAYYRLKLASLLKREEKCIYLDVDICVCQDLTSLYEIELEGDYIAGVKAAGYYYPDSKVRKQLDMLQIEAFDRYINSGVILMNLKKIREDGLEQKFEQLVENKFTSEDQDVLNCACYPYIKILEPKYNLMTKYPVSDMDGYDKEKCLQICYDKESWRTAIENPVIIHFADFRKPWLYVEDVFAERWWEHFNDGIFWMRQQKIDVSVVLIDFYKFTQNRHAMKEYDLKEEGKKRLEIYEKKLQNVYDEKSELNRKLQRTYKEKSEINAKLKKTYEEKSEINAKLQQTYDEKAERGRQIRALTEELQEEKEKIEKQKLRIAEYKEKSRKLESRLKKKEKKYDELFVMYKKLEKRSIVCWIKKLLRRIRGK